MLTTIVFSILQRYSTVIIAILAILMRVKIPPKEDYETDVLCISPSESFCSLFALMKGQQYKDQLCHLLPYGGNMTLINKSDIK